MKILTGIILNAVLSVSLSSLYAQTGDQRRPDTKEVFVFRFTPGDDIFYDYVSTNSEEWKRLFDLIDRYRGLIDSREITVYVEGYCASGTDGEANRRMAVIRSNHVKSMLMLHRGLAEDNFKTTNRAIPYRGETDVSVVVVNVPEIQAEATHITETGQAEPAAEKVKTEPVVAPPADVPAAAVPPRQAQAAESEPAVRQPQQTPDEPKPATGKHKREGIFSLRVNLLYRLANMVNAGVEWRPSDHWGMLLNSGWSGTEWNGGDRKFRIWTVSPELRWYPGESGRWFIGAEGHIGKFNIQLTDTGYQGNFMGGGLTGGYRARLSRYFDMDFSLGIGYIYTDYDEYYREYGENIQINEQRVEKDIIGPTQVGVSLIWKLK